MTDRFRRDLR